MRKYKDDFTFEIIAENLTLFESEQLEMQTISEMKTTNREFGYNLSPGGTSGNIMSEQGKISRAEKMKKYYDDPEWVKNITQHIIDKKDDPEFRRKSKERIDAYFAVPENRQAHKERFKEINNRREVRLKRAKSKGGKPFYCVETGEIFLLLKDAADVFGVDKRTIHAVLKYPKRHKTIKRKWTFKYLEKEMSK